MSEASTEHTYLLVSLRSDLPKVDAIRKLFDHLQYIDKEVQVRPISAFGWVGEGVPMTEIMHYGGGN